MGQKIKDSSQKIKCKWLPSTFSTFNILSHKGNANPNYSKIPFYPSQIYDHQENNQQQMLARVQEKGSLMHSQWEM
jgi:hypothetical protein